jgi:hypothetical protein
MTNSSNDRLFRISLLLGLTTCIGLYVSEAIHFYRYGFDQETYIPVGNHPQCKSVNGSNSEFDCPVKGYGFARFRVIPPARHLVFTDPLDKQ